MSTPTVERTGDWDSVPFAGGHAGLRDLADDEFSGMVTAGPARLFMLRGAVVGILDGDVDDFADGGGTAREAPHPALPLLAVMQERSDEVRAEYYTEETPISEVDRTLADGNFTGYIELSENVLSGDYYQVYHQGRSMSVAYVGASERLIVDDEAFEQADDEVGIYKVRPAEVEIIDIPEPDDAGSPDDAAGAGAAGAGEMGDSGTGGDETADGEPADVDSTTVEPADDASSDADAEVTDADSATTEGEAGPSEGNPGATGATEDATGDGDTPSEDASSTPSGDDTVNESPTTGTQASGSPAESSSEGRASTTDSGASTGSSGATGTGAASTESTTPDSTSSPAASGEATESRADTGVTQTEEPTGGSQQGQPAPDHPAAASRGQGGQSGTAASTTADRPEGSISAGDLEVRSLPSLDPSRTASASRQERERRSSASGEAVEQVEEPRQSPQGAEQSGAESKPQQSGGTQAESTGGSNGGAQSNPQTVEQSGGAAAEQSTSDGGAATGTATDEAAAETADASQTSGADAAGTAGDTQADAGLEEARAEVERLESELADLRGDHESVVEERDRLQSELAEAREEIQRLRSRLEDAAGQADAASQKLSPHEAIDETNLFIRYDSKGEATLEKAHAGDVGKDDVDANLRLEYHTSFDAADAAVDGVGFDAFLTDTVQYRFVDWLVRNLLYEIRDTGNTGPMGELYDALPKVDRAELNGQVGVQYSEDGQEHRAQVGFDVIVRDRMGNPLIVANLNDSRDPATDSMMTDLVRAAERVGESSSSLAGAFLVTESFFAPEALETAEEATAGGLLNRGKQKSFVNLSRKGGYHLCLVEARNQEFHLAVPEL